MALGRCRPRGVAAQALPVRVRRATASEAAAVASVCSEVFGRDVSARMRVEEPDSPLLPLVLRLEDRGAQRTSEDLVAQLQRLEARKQQARVRALAGCTHGAPVC